MAKIGLGPIINQGLGKLDDRVFTRKRQTKYFRQNLDQNYPDTLGQRVIKDYERRASEVWNGIDGWYFGDPRESDLRFNDIWCFIVRNLISPPRPAFVGSFIEQAVVANNMPENITLTLGKSYSLAPLLRGVSVFRDFILVEMTTPRQYHRDITFPLAFTVLTPVYHVGGSTPLDDFYAVYRAHIVRQVSTEYVLEILLPDELEQWDRDMLLYLFMVYVKRDLNPIPISLQVTAPIDTFVSESVSTPFVVPIPRWSPIPIQMVAVDTFFSLNLHDFVSVPESDGLLSYLPSQNDVEITVTGLPEGFSALDGVVTGESSMSSSTDVAVRAENELGFDDSMFELVVESPRAPEWLPIDVGIWQTDQSSTLDLNAFVLGSPTPTLMLQNPDNLEMGLTFSDGIISGMPVNARNQQLTVRASNSEGMADVSFSLGVVAKGVPTFNPPSLFRFRQRAEVYTVIVDLWQYATNADSFIGPRVWLVGQCRRSGGTVTVRVQTTSTAFPTLGVSGENEQTAIASPTWQIAM